VGALAVISIAATTVGAVKLRRGWGRSQLI
jgi:hypothetical protein